MGYICRSVRIRLAELRPIVNSSVNASHRTAWWLFVQLFRQGHRWVISVFESRLKRFCNTRLGNQEEEDPMAEKGTDPFCRPLLSLKLSTGMRLVGNVLFEDCSAFTHVTACTLAKSPSDPLHQRLQPLCYLHDCSDCFRLERNLPAGTLTHWKTPP